MRLELYNDDCMSALDKLIEQGVKVDAVFTDPPYLIRGNGFKSVAGGFKDRDIFKNDIKNIKDGFDFAVLDKCEKLLKKWNAYFYCNKDLLFDLIEYFKKKDVFMDVLVECITNPTPFCNNTYLNDIDYVLFVREKGVKVSGTYRSKKKFRVKNTNKKDKQLYNHPTCKYVSLITEYVANSTNEEDVVLDPFMGSGSTGVACRNLNRNFIGIELDEEYFNTAEERIKQCE